MKQLYILRHAKTNQISPTGRDFDRELLPKGIDQVQGLTFFFEENPLKNKTEIWVSSAKRTRKTFEGIKKTLESFSTVISVQFFDDLYLVSDADLLKKIWNHSSGHDLLIVGHNFGISDLTSYFTEKEIELRTGEFIHLSFDCDNWNETSRGLAIVSNRFRPIS
jgi:phosphohistidine phosphatase